MNNDEKKKIKDRVGVYVSKAFLDSKPSYFVPDIENCEKDEVKYIFLCESPHNDEVNYKETHKNEQSIPLAGKSGIDVYSFLFDNDESKKPIGELVNNKDPNLPKIAIVNVCNIPLQVIDANKNDIAERDLKYIRDNNIIIDCLLEDLKKRLGNYSNADKIVVCGEFASAYFDKADLETLKGKALYVPHPSRNSWNFIYKHKGDIDELKELFNRKTDS